MDELDQEILMQLKEDSRRTVTEISKAIGRSHSATRVRVNNLMKSGVISRFTIELANYKDELLPKGYVDVVLPNGAKAERIADVLKDIEEVCDIALVTGKFTCQVLIQCEAVAKMKELSDIIQERLGSTESRVRIITGSVPGYPRSNNPIYLSHLTERIGIEELDATTKSIDNTADVSAEEADVEDIKKDSNIIEEANELAEIHESTDDDVLVWSFSSPEEKVVREERPVIGA
ncbi:MAG: Lrp/AsnC family transcriptional regulator [Acidimicrobiales bacterium]|nr:Lrp/AsnC family transcriptional regulator [Acidimicrobiales bacterium]|tara:strand:- start:1093 stop:1791 length:699 start_codon:yes stop_codon:yes gene_type:complete